MDNRPLLSLIISHLTKSQQMMPQLMMHQVMLIQPETNL